MIWLIVVCCLLISFLFAGIEAGILSVNRVRLRHNAKLGDSAAIRLEQLLGRPARLLLTVLIVTNLMNIFAVILSTDELVRVLGTKGYLIALLVWLPLYLLVIGLLPKALFRRFPYRALAAVAELLRLTNLILNPLLVLCSRIARLFLKSTGQRKLFAAREDVRYFTIEGERVGTLTKMERELIDQVMNFRSITARELMVPGERVQSISADATIDELLELSRNTNLDRIPLTASDGAIVGIVDAFELLLNRKPGDDLRMHQRRLLRVSVDESAFNLIRKLRAGRIGLAAVIDTDQRPLGIVSTEDVIERLVSAKAQASTGESRT